MTDDPRPLDVRRLQRFPSATPLADWLASFARKAIRARPNDPKAYELVVCQPFETEDPRDPIGTRASGYVVVTMRIMTIQTEPAVRPDPLDQTTVPMP